MDIRNKAESIKVIKELDLNTLPEIQLDCFDELKARQFMNETKAQFFDVRDRSAAGSKKYAVRLNQDDIIIHLKTTDLQKFTIILSPHNYANSQMLVGEILIHPNNKLDYILSHNPSYITRDVNKNPDFKGTTDIFDKKLKKIKGLNQIIDFVFEKNLVGIIVEFSVFDCPVGLKNENIVIWELRTSY